MVAPDAPSRPSNPALPRFTRLARCYAPDRVTAVLVDVATAPQLALVVDVDTLERSALAKVDRVMILALDALAQTGVRVILTASTELERATLLQRCIAAATVMGDDLALPQLRKAYPDLRMIVLSESPAWLERVGPRDCGIALGRPELVRANVASAGDTEIRATLWWLLAHRERATGG
jgi:hypothetical protein